MRSARNSTDPGFGPPTTAAENLGCHPAPSARARTQTAKLVGAPLLAFALLPLQLLASSPASGLSRPATTSTAAESPVLWENRFDLSHGTDVATDVAIYEDGVYAVGWGIASPRGAEWIVRAIDRESGGLLWMDAYDDTGNYDQPIAVAVDAFRVYAVGLTYRSNVHADWLVRTYERSSGALLWTQRVRVDIGGYAVARDALVEGDRLFVVGATDTRDGAFNFLVQALDARDGRLLWQDSYHSAGSYAIGYAAALQGKRLFVAGRARTAAGDFDPIIRAYHARSGKLLWSREVDRGLENGSAYDVVAGKEGVFVTGVGGDLRLLLAAYGARKGNLLWTDDAPPQGQSRAYSVALDDRGHVFIGGWAYAKPSSGWLMRGYLAGSGTRIWQQLVRYAPEHTSVAAIAVSGDRVIGAGYTEGLSARDLDWIVRVNDADTGHLQWDERLNTAVNYRDYANAVVVEGQRAYVAGASSTLYVADDFVVRAYRLQ